MITGSPQFFAIESQICQVSLRPGLMGLGFFVIHLLGNVYGVREPDATALACSYDSVGTILEQRGLHEVTLLQEVDAHAIAEAFRMVHYFPDQEDCLFFGMKGGDFSDLINEKQVVWAPDGDEAFDDSSYVLQFDVGNRVRLIAFKAAMEHPVYNRSTLREVWLPAEDFYGLLQDWRLQFEEERNEKLKRLPCGNA